MWLWYWLCFSNVTHTLITRACSSFSLLHWKSPLMDNNRHKKPTTNSRNVPKSVQTTPSGGISSTLRIQWHYDLHGKISKRNSRDSTIYFSFRYAFIKIMPKEIFKSSGKCFPNCKMEHWYQGVYRKESTLLPLFKVSPYCLGYWRRDIKHSSKNNTLRFL